MLIASIIISCIVYALMVVGLWFMFRKAGRRGWLSIIPFENLIVLSLIGWRKVWPFIMTFVYFFAGYWIISIGGAMVILEMSNAAAIIVIIIGIIVMIFSIILYVTIQHRVSLSFEKGVGFTVGMVFVPFIMYPILGLGDSVYNDDIVVSMFSKEYSKKEKDKK